MTSSELIHLGHAVSRLHDAATRIARIQASAGDHLAGRYADELQHALITQRTHLVRAERDLDEVATALRRSTP